MTRPVAGVDIDMARKILDYNNRRYPDGGSYSFSDGGARCANVTGIFFLYFTARLHTAQCEPEKAIACLQRALDLQLEYVQLQHMCLVSSLLWLLHYPCLSWASGVRKQCS